MVGTLSVNKFTVLFANLKINQSDNFVFGFMTLTLKLTTSLNYQVKTKEIISTIFLRFYFFVSDSFNFY